MNQVILRPPISVRLRPAHTRGTILEAYVGKDGTLEGDHNNLEFHVEGKPPIKIVTEDILAPRKPVGWVYYLWRVLGLKTQLQKMKVIPGSPDQRFENPATMMEALERPPDTDYRPYYRIGDAQEDIDDTVAGLWRSDLCGHLDAAKKLQGELWLLDGNLTIMWDPVAYQRAAIAEQEEQRKENEASFRRLGPLGQAYDAHSDFMHTKRRILQRHQWTRCHISLYRALKSTRKILEDRLRPLIPELPEDTAKAITDWIEHRDEEDIQCDYNIYVHIYDKYHAPKPKS